MGEMLDVVAPALREILSVEELAATSTRVIRQTAGHSMLTLEDWPTLTADDQLDDETLLAFQTFDDQGGSWMQGRETATQMYKRFRSELQDFVAESKFGWGQLRP
ncbi:hypothetical protein [Amnibacterium endophyticum]|uniref:Uncharacterized protein n=1 Tax=Amnibacterium endophyticum TaxID=2109337 RepID=A0ABW4LG13_9MICO